MKYKINEPVLDYEKNPIKEGKELLTWKAVVHYALNTRAKADEVLSKDKALMCFSITKRAFEEKEPEFTIEEVAFILSRIALTYKPLVIGRAEEFFNKKT